MTAPDPNCPRCHGVGHYAPSDGFRTFDVALKCDCKVPAPESEMAKAFQEIRGELGLLGSKVNALQILTNEILAAAHAAGMEEAAKIAERGYVSFVAPDGKSGGGGSVDEKTSKLIAAAIRSRIKHDEGQKESHSQATQDDPALSPELDHEAG